MATDNLHISQLQQKISVGDERALKELHGLISEGLFQLSVSIVRSTQLAEEVVEDVFIKCWEQGTLLASIRNLKAYLYVLTRNISLDYLRRVSGKKRYRLEEVSVPLLLVEATPEDILISAELIKKINAIINDLPPRCKLIFKLVKVDGLKHKEVAQLLNLSLKTVEAQMGIALKKLHTSITLHLPVYSRK
jgi:RNA polymerase sigma-70 factor (ECF subfamily)